MVLSGDVVLVPGMIDTHLHAPQWPQLGVGVDLPLERWVPADLLGIEAGVLEPGRQFDALAVSLVGLGVDPGLDGPDRVFEKLDRLAGTGDITEVWVAGRPVSPS